MEREFIANHPRTGNRRVFALDVYYDIDERPIGEQLTVQDALADECAVNGICAGSGCGSGGVRDREYWFDSDSDRAEAKTRFQEAGFRFFCHEECLLEQS